MRINEPDPALKHNGESVSTPGSEGVKPLHPRRWIIPHPVFFACFPILSLFSSNPEHIFLSELVYPLSLVAGLAVAFYIIAALLLRDRERSAMVVSATLILFFSYGPLSDFFRSKAGWGAILRYELYLLILWGVVLTGCLFFLLRTRRKLTQATKLLNWVSGFAVLTSVGAAVYGKMNQPEMIVEERREVIAESPGTKLRLFLEDERIREENSPSPDIYHIVLDAYARADVLEELYDYDNRPFLESLEGLGFHVVPSSTSNYCFTYLSIASALNHAYVQQFADLGIPQGHMLRDAIHDSRAVRLVRQRGYSFVTFATGYQATRISDSDLFLSPPRNLTEFHSVLIGTTPIAPLIRIVRKGWGIKYERQRARVLFTLDRLPDLAKIESPTYVFAHVVSPHWPFVMDRWARRSRPEHPFARDDAGHSIVTERDRETFREGYVEQLRGLNGKLLDAIEGILERSPQPPIILLHSDHGPDMEMNWDDPAQANLTERMSILFAVYLPDGDYRDFYDTMTPVNGLRTVLNRFAGVDLPLLEDRNYFSNLESPFDFLDVTERLARDHVD